MGVVAVFALALSARLYYLHEIRVSPLFTAPVVDARTYTEEARYLSDVSFAGRPAPFWQPPLYPVLLGVLFALAGDDLYLPRLIQAVIGALVCVLICLLGYRVFGAGVGLGAGVAAALYGPLIYFGGELLPTLLACCLNLLVLLLAAGEGGWGRALAAGVLLGLSALAVANVLLFAPVLLGYLYWRQRRLRPPALLLLGCALVIAPVAYRNWAVGDDLVLISHNAGINFYIGNNADYAQTTRIRPGRAWAELVEMPERRASIEQPSAKSRYFFAQSWQYITSEPLDFLGLLAYKSYLFLRGDEIPRNRDLYFARNDSSLLSILLWKKGLAFPFGLVAPLALVGLFAFLRSPEPAEGALARALCGLLCAVRSPVFRHRALSPASRAGAVALCGLWGAHPVAPALARARRPCRPLGLLQYRHRQDGPKRRCPRALLSRLRLRGTGHAGPRCPPLPPRPWLATPTSPSHSSRSPRSTARPSATARPSTSIAAILKRDLTTRMYAFSSATPRCSLGATMRLQPRTLRSQRCVPTGPPRTAASATPS